MLYPKGRKNSRRVCLRVVQGGGNMKKMAKYMYICFALGLGVGTNLSQTVLTGSILDAVYTGVIFIAFVWYIVSSRPKF